jgi:hypothetical protein
MGAAAAGPLERVGGGDPPTLRGSCNTYAADDITFRVGTGCPPYDARFNRPPAKLRADPAWSAAP